MSNWRVLLTPGQSGRANMLQDTTLFAEHEAGENISTLRIYSWHPKCISLGYSQKTDEVIDRTKAQTLGWDVVVRPTGGGVVFHNEEEVTYSIVTLLDNPLLPKGLTLSYKKLSRAVITALKLFGLKAELAVGQKSARTKVRERAQLCFSYPAEYEIVVAGKKIVGSAQKRGRRTLLQQGSIFVRQPAAETLTLLKLGGQKYDAMSVEELLGRVVSFEEMSAALVKGFEETLGVKLKT